MSVYLTIRTQSELDVRYDAPPPGRLHEGAVSLTLADGVFAIFDCPDAVDDIAHKLLTQGSKWRAALNAGRPDSGRHSYSSNGPDTAELAELPDLTDVDEGQAEDVEPVAGYRPDPLEDTLVLYPDPAALKAQADALMDGDR